MSSPARPAYHAEGRRVAKGTVTPSPQPNPQQSNYQAISCNPNSNGFQMTESYILGHDGQEMTTMAMANGSLAWQRTNIHAQGQLIATVESIPDPNNPSPAQIATLHFHLTDPLGTRRMQTSSVGQPEEDCQSLPYGDQLNCFPDQYAAPTADDGTPLHFTGKHRDQETGEANGNDYFGARYYASSMGRFMSPDWSAREEPVPYAKLENPQTLNLYSYAGNDPLVNLDEDGHDWDGFVKYWEHVASNTWNSWQNAARQMYGGLELSGKLLSGDARFSIAHPSGKDLNLIAGNVVPLIVTDGEGGAARLGAMEGELIEGAVAARAEALEARLGAAETWGNPDTLERHFADHGADFGSKSSQEYADQASRFLQDSQSNKLPTKIDSDGVIRVYDPKTNSFGAYNANGTTRTFFKPKSKTYFQRQPGQLVQ